MLPNVPDSIQSPDVFVPLTVTSPMLKLPILQPLLAVRLLVYTLPLLSTPNALPATSLQLVLVPEPPMLRPEVVPFPK